MQKVYLPCLGATPRRRHRRRRFPNGHFHAFNMQTTYGVWLLTGEIASHSAELRHVVLKPHLGQQNRELSG